MLRCAHKLGMSLQRFQRETTSSEFVEWMEYFRQEVNDFHREDYFHAQTAAVIARAHSKRPREISIKQFLLKFKTSLPRRTVRPDRESLMKRSKAFWLGALGIKRKK